MREARERSGRAQTVSGAETRWRLWQWELATSSFFCFPRLHGRSCFRATSLRKSVSAAFVAVSDGKRGREMASPESDPGHTRWKGER